MHPKIKLSPLKRARALVMFERGLTREGTINHLQRDFHPTLSPQEVEKLYFPKKGQFAIGKLEHSSREEKIKQLQTMKTAARRASKRMKKLFKNPEFRAAVSKRARVRMTLLHQDPTFAQARDKRATQVMEKLHANPKFVKKLKRSSGKNMKKLQQRKEFRAAHKKRMIARFKNNTVREKYAQRMRIRMQNPKERKKIGRIGKRLMTEHWNDPVFKEAHHKRLIAQHQNPTFAAHRDSRASQTFLKLNQNPAFREASRLRLKQHWENPEFVKNMFRGINQYRREQKANRIKHGKITKAIGFEDIESRGGSIAGKPAAIATSTLTPAKAAIRMEEENKIHNALIGLDNRTQEIITMAFGFDGDPLTHSQIARVLKTSKEEINATLQNAFAQLAKKLR